MQHIPVNNTVRSPAECFTRDTVWTAPGEEHRHGGTIWLEFVTDQQYQDAHQK